MDSKTENLKAELKRLHVETAERVVCRRLRSLVGPGESHNCLNCRWQWASEMCGRCSGGDRWKPERQIDVDRDQARANNGGEGRGASPRTSPPHGSQED